ncbi:MAG TPA: 9-O-acetylesterase, partial [Phnomibacter sp.]|nr:9-O-acetylesterase [Phnomibacter sp.]
MKMLYQQWAITSLLCAASISSNAKITLPWFFADNMVLQQQTNAAIWGKAKAGSYLKITPSWNKASYITQA